MINPDITNAARGWAVTPSDTVNLTESARLLYVGGAGNLSLLTAGGSSISLSGVLAGTFVPVQVARVNATGTTATNIVALV